MGTPKLPILLLILQLAHHAAASSEALKLLQGLSSKKDAPPLPPEEHSDLNNDDLIYSQITQQLKNQQQSQGPLNDSQQSSVDAGISFRDFYRSIQSDQDPLLQSPEEQPNEQSEGFESFYKTLRSDDPAPQLDYSFFQAAATPEAPASVPVPAPSPNPTLTPNPSPLLEEESTSSSSEFSDSEEESEDVQPQATSRARGRTTEPINTKNKDAEPEVLNLKFFKNKEKKQEGSNDEKLISEEAQNNVGKATLLKKIQEYKNQKREEEEKEKKQQAEREERQLRSKQQQDQIPLKRTEIAKEKRKRIFEIDETADQEVDQHLEERKEEANSNEDVQANQSPPSPEASPLREALRDERSESDSESSSEPESEGEDQNKARNVEEGEPNSFIKRLQDEQADANGIFKVENQEAASPQTNEESDWKVLKNDFLLKLTGKDEEVEPYEQDLSMAEQEDIQMDASESSDDGSLSWIKRKYLSLQSDDQLDLTGDDSESMISPHLSSVDEETERIFKFTAAEPPAIFQEFSQIMESGKLEASQVEQIESDQEGFLESEGETNDSNAKIESYESFETRDSLKAADYSSDLSQQGNDSELVDTLEEQAQSSIDEPDQAQNVEYLDQAEQQDQPEPSNQAEQSDQVNQQPVSSEQSDPATDGQAVLSEQALLTQQDRQGVKPQGEEQLNQIIEAGDINIDLIGELDVDESEDKADLLIQNDQRENLKEDQEQNAELQQQSKEDQDENTLQEPAESSKDQESQQSADSNQSEVDSQQKDSESPAEKTNLEGIADRQISDQTNSEPTIQLQSDETTNITAKGVEQVIVNQNQVANDSLFITDPQDILLPLDNIKQIQEGEDSDGEAQNNQQLPSGPLPFLEALLQQQEVEPKTDQLADTRILNEDSTNANDEDQNSGVVDASFVTKNVKLIDEVYDSSYLDEENKSDQMQYEDNLEVSPQIGNQGQTPEFNQQKYDSQGDLAEEENQGMDLEMEIQSQNLEKFNQAPIQYDEILANSSESPNKAADEIDSFQKQSEAGEKISFEDNEVTQQGQDQGTYDSQENLSQPIEHEQSIYEEINGVLKEQEKLTSELQEPLKNEMQDPLPMVEESKKIETNEQKESQAPDYSQTITTEDQSQVLDYRTIIETEGESAMLEAQDEELNKLIDEQISREQTLSKISEISHQESSVENQPYKYEIDKDLDVPMQQSQEEPKLEESKNTSRPTTTYVGDELQSAKKADDNYVIQHIEFESAVDIEEQTVDFKAVEEPRLSSQFATSFIQRDRYPYSKHPYNPYPDKQLEPPKGRERDRIDPRSFNQDEEPYLYDEMQDPYDEGPNFNPMPDAYPELDYDMIYDYNEMPQQREPQRQLRANNKQQRPNKKPQNRAQKQVKRRPVPEYDMMQDYNEQFFGQYHEPPDMELYDNRNQYIPREDMEMNQAFMPGEYSESFDYRQLKSQQDQIQRINQQLVSNEFSFQQIITRIEKENQFIPKARLAGNPSRIHSQDQMSFFQLTESQYKNQQSTKSTDLFQAIKNEMKDCSLNKFTKKLCKLCQSDVVFEIDNDNWYLIGLAYGLKRHFQNLLNTIDYHFKNSTIFTAFNKDAEVCIAMGNDIKIENLEQVLNHFSNSSILKLQTHPLVKLPIKLDAQYMQVVASLNTSTFKNFSLIHNSSIPESHNGFSIETKKLQIANSAVKYEQTGGLLFPNQKIRYSFSQAVQSPMDHEEIVKLNLSKQDYSTIVRGYLSGEMVKCVDQIVNRGGKELLEFSMKSYETEQEIGFEIEIQK